MKACEDVIYRCIADEHVLVPVGSAAMETNGLVVLNELGAEIWKLLETERTEEEIVAAVVAEYEVEEAVARADVREFLRTLEGRGFLV